QALPGGDSIVFLRSNRTDTTNEPFSVPDSTSSIGFRYVQGTIGHPHPADPSVPPYPIISDIWTNAGGEQVIHTLNGVTSLERTLRVNRADKSLAGGRPQRAIYYLIADASGVFEFRYDPNQPVDPPTTQNPFPRDHGPRLAWAFTNDDYNYVSGGGNGNPNSVRSDPTGRYTSGRTFTAASARLMSNGQVLIATRPPRNPPPPPPPPPSPAH